MCKLCGKFAYDSAFFGIANMTHHLSSHFEGIIIESVNGCSIRINGTKTYSVIAMVNIIPQLLYITPTIEDCFINPMLKIIRRHKKEIFRTPYTAYGSISAILYENVLSEHRHEIINMFDNIQFKCSMVVGVFNRSAIESSSCDEGDSRTICGQIYECGLPTADLVMQHLSSHFV